MVTDSTEVVKTASKSIQLDVIAKPRVTLVPMTLYLKPGQADTLTCTVNSEKDVTITWSINNKTVDNIGGNAVIKYFSFQPVLYDWCNKCCGMCYPVCGMVHVKEPLLLIEKSSPCGGSGFPLSLSDTI